MAQIAHRLLGPALAGLVDAIVIGDKERRRGMRIERAYCGLDIAGIEDVVVMEDHEEFMILGLLEEKASLPIFPDVLGLLMKGKAGVVQRLDVIADDLARVAVRMVVADD